MTVDDRRLLLGEGLLIAMVPVGTLGSSSSLVSHALHRLCNLYSTAVSGLRHFVSNSRGEKDPRWRLYPFKSHRQKHYETLLLQRVFT